jgi:hypothetical protein
MSRTFPVRLILSAIAIATAVACGEHASPTAPPLAALAPPPKPPKGHTVAACNIPMDMDFSGQFGPRGGKLDLGPGNSLQILPGALREVTTITAHVPKGTQAKVQFGPEGLQFAVPTILTASYSTCVTPLFGVSIAYLQADTVVEVEPSVNDPIQKKVTAFLSHFSSYAVAY